MKTKDTIQGHFDRACDLLEQEVERLARQIMRKHKNVTAFVMAMGSATFDVRINGKTEDLGLDERAYFKPLNDLIDKWDDIFHITGCPMWIKGPDGEVIRDW